MRFLGQSYANANLNAAVTIATATGVGAQLSLFPASCQRFRVACYGAGVWVKLSKGAVVAAQQGLGGEVLVTPQEPEIFNMGTEWDNLSIINSGAGCFASVSPVDPNQD